MSELRAPDPTLTALLNDPERSIVSVANHGRGPAVAHLMQPGPCDPHDDFARMYAAHARWFAVPCRVCFPDAPPPGFRWDTDRPEDPNSRFRSRHPHLAWQVPS